MPQTKLTVHASAQLQFLCLEEEVQAIEDV